MPPPGTFPEEPECGGKQRPPQLDKAALTDSQQCEPSESQSLLEAIVDPQQRAPSPYPYTAGEDQEAATRPVAPASEHRQGPTVVSNPLFVRSFKRRVRTRDRRGYRYKTLSSTADLRLHARQGEDDNEEEAEDDWEVDETFIGGVREGPLIEERDESDACDLGSPGSDSVFSSHHSPSPTLSPITSPKKNDHKTDFLARWRTSPSSPPESSELDTHQEAKERSTGLSFLSRLSKSVSPKKKHYRPSSKSSGGDSSWENMTDASTSSGGEAAPLSPPQGSLPTSSSPLLANLPASPESFPRPTKIPVRTEQGAASVKSLSPAEGVAAETRSPQDQNINQKSVAPPPKLPPPPLSRKYGVRHHSKKSSSGRRAEPCDPGTRGGDERAEQESKVTIFPYMCKDTASPPKEIHSAGVLETMERPTPSPGPHSAPWTLGHSQALSPGSAASTHDTSHSARTRDASPRKNKFFPGFVFLGDGGAKKTETERGSLKERERKDRGSTTERKVNEAIATLSQGRLRRVGALRKGEDLHRLVGNAPTHDDEAAVLIKTKDDREAPEGGITGPSPWSNQGSDTGTLENKDEMKAKVPQPEVSVSQAEEGPAATGSRQLSERFVKNRPKRPMERSTSVPFWTKLQLQEAAQTVGGAAPSQVFDEDTPEPKTRRPEGKIEHMARSAPDKEQRKASHKRARSQDATRSFSAEIVCLTPSRSSSHENLAKRDKTQTSGVAVNFLTAENEREDTASLGCLEPQTPKRHTSCVDVVLASQNDQQPSYFTRGLWDSKLRSVSAACLAKKNSGGKSPQSTKWFDEAATPPEKTEGGGSPKAPHHHMYTSPYEMLAQPKERPYIQRLMGVFAMLGAVS